jgi:hypothetical protein
VVPDGWDATGQPVGRPWSTIRTPLIQIIAVSEKQTKNTWRPLLEMAEGPVVDEYPGVEPLDTFVNLPRGKIEPITSSPRSTKGNPSDFAVCDQTEEWVQGNGGLNLFEKVKNNTAKRGGSFIESPNAYTPGDDSVAEHSAAYAQSILEGRAWDDGLYYDHREAPAETEIFDRESITMGLRIAYGDSSAHPDGCVIHDPPCPPGHVDLDVLIGTIWAEDSDIQVSRSDFLNQVTHATNSFVSQPRWLAVRDTDKDLVDGDLITMAFDGSRGRAKGKPDATALIGCRVSDGHLFQLGVWEADEVQSTWDTWSPPIVEIEAAIASAFKRYKIGAFYCDPAKDWRSYVNTWEATYSRQLAKGVGGKQVTVTREHPFEWWMTGGRTGLIQRAVEQLDGAIKNRDLTHDGSLELTRHMLQARRRFRSGKLSLAKENDYSPKKIDAAVAAVLAWQARLDVLAAGLSKTPRRGVPRRVR